DGAGADEAAAELVRALLAEPEAIVPVLAELAARRELPPLAARLPVTAWSAFARAAVAAAGAPAAEAVVPGEAAAAAGSPLPQETIAAAARIEAASRIAQAAAAVVPGAALPALAALAVLEVEPARLRGLV